MKKHNQQQENLQQLAALSALKPADPLQQLGGLLGLVSALQGMDQNSARLAMDQGRFNREGEQIKFGNEQTVQAGQRQDRQLNMGQTELDLRGRQVGLAEKRAPLDAQYIQSQINSNNTQTGALPGRLDFANKELTQQGLLGLLSLMANPYGGQGLIQTPIGQQLIQGLGLGGLDMSPPQGPNPLDYIRKEGIPIQPTVKPMTPFGY